jgi:3-hydroxyacyl-CoA dehydrogenase
VDAEAILASTTSSLSVASLAEASGRADRFVGLHVFNPVTKMKLVELIFPPRASADTRRRAAELCESFEKVPVEVPDIPGFVVNRLLFPYLFSAVRLLEETGVAAADIDTCMRLGAGHPMGPLALLDLVGLDVAKAIGETIGEQVPPRVEELVAEGALGRKSGRGLHSY